ncbi:MAG: TonB-dependent receptor [Kordiimonadaceae bacterium]|nr:TonB-dependent receptor [Kordiimonadaceae bacterium]
MTYISTNRFKRTTSIVAILTATFLGTQCAYGADAETVSLEEITVSASRLKKDGFSAPTPVTVVGVEQMEIRGTTNVADILNQIPAFSGSATPTSTNLDSRENGTNGLSLRSLGTNRNLVLVNGRRHVPTNEFGTVNINVIPSIAIERVEVVTGGASAAWGSDAISGVVNIIYEKDLEGFKFDTQYGVSSEGDAQNYRAAFAYGSHFSNDRGHFMVAAEYNDNKGVPKASARDWSEKQYAFFGDSIKENARFFLGSPNGVTLPGGPVGDLEFLPDGTAIPRDIDIDTKGGNFIVGGAGSTLTSNGALSIPVERTNILGTFDYQVTETTNFYMEGSYAESKSLGNLIDSFTFGASILSGNAYLPASVQTLLDDNGLAGFGLYRTNPDIGTIATDAKSKNVRIVTGLNGEMSSDWTWDLYFQYGRSDFSNQQPHNIIKANLAEAVDAIIDPVSGSIVCRSGNPDCTPISLFGSGSPSQAAIDYVSGTGMSDTVLKQHVVAATFSGDLMEGWAGPISTAFGAEYRKESLNRTVDDISDNFGYLITNAQPLAGQFDVKEAFAEVLIPLISPDSTGQELNFNGAVRYTDYSTSGTVTTWKAGLTYEPIADLKIRGTISRDIRAPSIGEVFLETLLLFSNPVNPFTGGSTELVEVFNTGNDTLTAERALTKTIGMVYSPSWLEGFRVSVDWYDIDIEDAISQITEQEIVNRCFAGESNLCDLITFAPDQTIISMERKLLNLAIFRVKGVDFEAQYIQSLDNGATLAFDVLGSYVHSLEGAPNGVDVFDAAGDVGKSNGTGQPHWKARANVTYAQDTWGVNAQVRYVGGGKYDKNLEPEGLPGGFNDISAEYYLDVSARYKFSLAGNDNMELYGGINNAFDNDPPIIPLIFIAPAATNAVLYDVIGRYFYVGVRATF